MGVEDQAVMKLVVDEHGSGPLRTPDAGSTQTLTLPSSPATL
jgi:hypothetical protein